ncbi:MAG: hypothetical protein LAT66_05460 [Alkalimonas sp.]|nr:hypothetical protein [Alkalimonas sp.]
MALLRKVAKGLWWLLLSVLLVLLSLYLLLRAINWQDEAPSEAALSLLAIQQQAAQVDDTDNGYLHFVQRGELARLSPSTTLHGLFQQCEQGDCHKALTAARAQLPELIRQHQPLVDLYQQLHSFTHWYQPIPAHPAELPAYQPLMNAQRLHLLQVWLAVQQDDFTTARQLLQDDLQFWRLTLRHKSHILSTMISQVALQRHFAFSQMLMQQSLPPHLRADIAAAGWQQPFSPEELSLKPAYAGEWLYGVAMMRVMLQTELTDTEQPWAERLLSRLLKPFFLPQASANDYAALLMTCLDDQQPRPVLWYHWLYNPVGKLLNHVGSLDCQRISLQGLEQQRQQTITIASAAE